MKNLQRPGLVFGLILLVVASLPLLAAAHEPLPADGAVAVPSGQDPQEPGENVAQGQDPQEAGEGTDQGQESEAEAVDVESLPPVEIGVTDEQQAALQLVEQILAEQQLLLAGQNFVYQAQNRRDPFRSLLLLRQREIAAPELRPDGLPGFLINEIEVSAVARYQGRWQAMIVGVDGRTYFIEVGDELYDGRVVEIHDGEVVFEQEVEDLMGARSTRRVIRSMVTETQD